MASTSKVQVANRALAVVGEPAITSFSEDNNAARIVNQRYDSVRRWLLAKHPWSAAIKLVALAEDASETPAFTYARFFFLPSDWLRIIKINDGTTRYLRTGKRLATSASSINLIYLADVEDLNEFDESLIEALVYALAEELVIPLTHDETLLRLIGMRAEKKLNDAKSDNAQQLNQQELVADVWLDSRVAWEDEYRAIEDP